MTSSFGKQADVDYLIFIVIAPRSVPNRPYGHAPNHCDSGNISNDYHKRTHKRCVPPTAETKEASRPADRSFSSWPCNQGSDGKTCQVPLVKKVRPSVA